jgi:hypothetical protein
VTSTTEARTPPPYLDVERLGRVLQSAPNKVAAWLREDMSTGELCGWIAAEYARLASDSTPEQP